jgi:hypothetical protein
MANNSKISRTRTSSTIYNKIKEMKKNGKPGITTFDCHG